MTDQPASTSTSALSMTPLAVQKIKGLMAEKNLTAHGLRVFVAGGGCSGLQYGMAFEETVQPSDTVVEIDGLRLIIDEGSLPCLLGAHIDFIDSLMGGGFRIDNPNAVTTCGCGQSFRTKNSRAQAGSCCNG